MTASAGSVKARPLAGDARHQQAALDPYMALIVRYRKSGPFC